MSLLLTLIVIGVLLYLLGLIPMDAVFYNLIRAVAIIYAVFAVIQYFGLLGRLHL